jgi:hypothetical protein
VELGVSHYVADASASGEDDETDESWR